MTNLSRYSYPLSRSSERFFGSEHFPDFDRLFDLATKRPSATPNYDLYEDDNHFFAQVEMPGVKRDRVTLEIEGDRLTLSVQPEADAEATTSWTRAFTVPENVVSGEVGAKLEDGILTLSLPKSELPKPRQIEVK